MDDKYIAKTLPRCQFWRQPQNQQCKRKARVFWDSGNYCRQHSLGISEAQEKLIDWKKNETPE